MRLGFEMVMIMIQEVIVSPNLSFLLRDSVAAYLVSPRISPETEIEFSRSTVVFESVYASTLTTANLI